MLLEVIAIAEEIGSQPAGQSVLEVCAGLGGPRGRLAARRALLTAPRRRRHEQTGLQRDPADEAFLAPLMAKVRQALGDVAFASHQLAGNALSYEKAVSEALSWLRSRS